LDWIKKLQKMWNENRSYKKLEWIEFDEKGIRGIKNIKIEFKYPITAIAGVNGVGKTTILQTIACLFHNNDKTYRPYRLSNAKHQPPYYRFSDFFVFTRDEENFKKGIKIEYFFDGKSYNINRDNRWSKYERRPKKYVDYIGVSRVLPSYEFSTFKNTFKGNYKILDKKTLDNDTKSIISNILNNPLKDIEEISSKKISNFKLNNIKIQDELKYSNFNMGAGEEVAISLISRISLLKENSLILIEEIELGLHPLAQKGLINELMKIAFKKNLQIIFTTHSPFIFDKLPSEARIFLKKTYQNIDIFYNAYKNLAFIELSGDSIDKLTVYVEDDIAKNILEYLLSSEITKKIKIMDVGDKRNVIKMLSAHIHNQSLGKALAILDGDVKEKDIKKACKDYCRIKPEQTEEYIEKYILQFPGELAPEKYILKKIKENNEFIKFIDNSSDFEHFIQILNLEDHHSLFFEVSKFLNKSEESIKYKIIEYFTKNYKNEFGEIIEKIDKELV
jgi:predicted ATP-dependent endonuclease of OLD family